MKELIEYFKSNDAQKDIISKINELGEEYKKNPGIILTETDMQCLLHKKLLEINILSRLYSTEDGHKASAVHTELSWFDKKGKLKLKPDITILAPNYLRITRYKSIHFPTKGFEFTKAYIAFELKFNRYESMTSFIKSIKKDIEKIDNLHKIYPDVTCYFVWLNKYNVDDAIINELIHDHDNDRKKIIYIKGGINVSN